MHVLVPNNARTFMFLITRTCFRNICVFLKRGQVKFISIFLGMRTHSFLWMHMRSYECAQVPRNVPMRHAEWSFGVYRTSHMRNVCTFLETRMCSFGCTFLLTPLPLYCPPTLCSHPNTKINSSDLQRV